MKNYFDDKNTKSEKKTKNHKILTTKLLPNDAFAFSATTLTSINPSDADFGLTAIIKSTGVACRLNLFSKVKNRKK